MRSFLWIRTGAFVVVSIICILADGPSASADLLLGIPENLGSPLNSVYADLMPSVSSDGLELYFWSNRPGGLGSWDLWSSTRPSSEDEWLPATNLGPKVNGAGIDAMPCISADGLELYFARGSEATAELMVSRRAAKTEPWGTAENLGAVVNHAGRDDSPMVTNDGLELYFVSTRAGGRGVADIWVTRRVTTTEEWGPPANVSAVNSGSYEQWATVSSDGLTLIFQSNRPGGQYGGLYVSRRVSRDDTWAAPVYFGLPMAGSVYTLLSSLSADGTMLYLSDHINYAPRAGGAGSADMWQVPILQIVDFNGDGNVDGADVRTMADAWGSRDLFCDIAPAPWGDGVVDAKDLKVLAGFIDQPVYDPTLVALWALDETEGAIAYDSAGENDASIIGEPIWQPDGGQVGGALSFDGLNDGTVTGFVLSPADGPFSVFAWVKGGAPGQVIIAQADGANWLAMDTATGCFGTELKGNGRNSSSLWSQEVITDGQWHRIGLAWDGTLRTLYVDDTCVAEDAHPSLPDHLGGLNIGCGADLRPTTYFSGLIDDVRIYNRAIKP